MALELPQREQKVNNLHTLKGGTHMMQLINQIRTWFRDENNGVATGIDVLPLAVLPRA